MTLSETAHDPRDATMIAAEDDPWQMPMGFVGEGRLVRVNSPANPHFVTSIDQKGES
jgi:hypothetical protein